jgi:hypothetical protein
MDADYTLVLHIAPDSTTTLEQISWSNANSVNKFIIAVRVGSKLVFVPWARDYVAIMDLSLANTPMHEVAVPGDLTGNLKKYSDGVLASDGSVYLAPCTAPYFAKIDPLTGLITRVDVSTNRVPWTRPVDISTEQCVYSSLVQGRNSKLYFAPEAGKYVFEMDLQDLALARQITVGSVVFGYGDMGLYSTAILASNGLIYLVPGAGGPLTNLQNGMGQYVDSVPITAICAPAQPKASLVCKPCPSNSFSLQGKATCTCNAGYEQALLGDVSCLLCPPESYRTLNEQSCVLCEGNRVLNPTHDGCWIACVSGQYRNPSTDLCEYCPPGYRMVGGTRLGSPASLCEQCAIGKSTPSRV